MFADRAPPETDTLAAGAQLRPYGAGQQRNRVILLTISAHLTTWRRTARKYKKERPEPRRVAAGRGAAAGASVAASLAGAPL